MGRAHTRILAVVVPLVATVAFTAAGCSNQHSATTASADAAAAPELGNTGNAGNAKGGYSTQADHRLASDSGASGAVQHRDVISTGEVELTSADVAAARDRVDALLAREHGRVADENTVTDDQGTVTRAHVVLRVPGSRFDQTMTSLAGLATLRSSSRKAEDVTTQVIDVKARIAAQKAGVRRLRVLVSRAANLPALLAVERELTARQGELESLQQQRAYLADQTSLATITVDITRHTTPSPVKRSTGGFVGGLRDGSHALGTVVVAALVALGAVLPFALVAAVIGVPIWLVVRRMRRVREPEAPPAEG